MAVKTKYVARFELVGDVAENAMVQGFIDGLVSRDGDRTVAWLNARWKWPSLVKLTIDEKIVHER